MMMRSMSPRKRTTAQPFPWNGLRVGRMWFDQGFALELHASKEPAGVDDEAVVRFIGREVVFRDSGGGCHVLRAA